MKKEMPDGYYASGLFGNSLYVIDGQAFNVATAKEYLVGLGFSQSEATQYLRNEHNNPKS